MQRLQSNIQSIKCASCKQELPFEEFMTHTQMCMLQDNYMIDQQQKFNSNENLANISPIKTRNKLQRLNSASSTEQKRQQQQSLVFERVRQPREYDSYLDLNEDCSTEAGGFKSQYGMQQIGQTNVQYAQRPSFLSSVDYNSFMDKGVNFMNNPNNNNQINQNFSPETIDRANGQQNKGFTQNQIRKLEERAKFFEVMYRQAQENIAKLNDDLKKQDSETERLIMDLKQTKIHIALLEETSAQREFMMKNEIDSLRHNQMVASQSQPEIKIHVNTTNYSCFNVGGSSVNNTHEIKIEPMNLLHKATQDQKVSYPPMRTPQTMKRKAQDLPKEQVYQETAPSTNHINRKQNHNHKKALIKYKIKDFFFYKKLFKIASMFIKKQIQSIRSFYTLFQFDSFQKNQVANTLIFTLYFSFYFTLQNDKLYYLFQIIFCHIKNLNRLNSFYQLYK